MKSIHEACVATAERFGAPGNYVNGREHRRLPQGGRRDDGPGPRLDSLTMTEPVQATSPPRGGTDFHELMRYRIMDILLVASPYDSFILEEDGQLGERVLGEFRNLDLHYGPGLTTCRPAPRRSSWSATRAGSTSSSAGSTLGDMNGAELARAGQGAGLDIPVVLLAFDARRGPGLRAHHDMSAVERIFLWQGDARILLAIVKYVEDRRNVAHDTRRSGVQVILLIEDNIRYYSSFLPVIYAELLHHSQRLISEGVNVSDKILRMRARPKILLCSTLRGGVGGVHDVPGATCSASSPTSSSRRTAGCPRTPGLDFARAGPRAVARRPGAAAVVEPRARGRRVGGRRVVPAQGLADAARRSAPLHDRVLRLRRLRVPPPDGARSDGATISSRSRRSSRPCRPSSIAYHAERNHFSRWLKARTEFALADELRPRKVSDFADPEERARVPDRDDRDATAATAAWPWWPTSTAARSTRATTSSASAAARWAARRAASRSCACCSSRRPIADGSRAVRDRCPPPVVLATDVFDRFLDDNDLRDFAIDTDDDAEIERRFARGALPAGRARRPRGAPAARRLAARGALVEPARGLAVPAVRRGLRDVHARRTAIRRARRSGSTQLVRAIMRVYASTFSQHGQGLPRAPRRTASRRRRWR